MDYDVTNMTTGHYIASMGITHLVVWKHTDVQTM